MKSITAYLESIGLSKTESQLYVLGLKRPSTVEELIRDTDIKPSTAYHALETLRFKGLAASIREDGRLLFTMSSPDELSSYIDEQSRELEQRQIELERLLPLFPASAPAKQHSYRVEHYESIDGVKRIVDEALECKDPEWRIIAPKNNFFSQYDQDYANYYLSRRQAHKIKAKTLWEAPIKASGKLTVRDIISRNPRYLPPKYRGQFDTVIIIFDNKVAYLSPLKNSESLLIESAHFTSTMRTMFDALWESSKDLLD